MADWSDKNLSMAGKEVLIKSVAQALVTYTMGVFKLPMGLCEDLMQQIRQYWWGAEQGKRKTHWVSWKNLVKPKCQGGMGFRDLQLFNQALLARQAWRLLLFPNSLCAKLLKAKYYPNGKLLDTAFPRNASNTWRAIEYGLELLKKGIIWRIGNGKNVHIWRDNWLPRNFYLKPGTRRRRSRLKWVSDLIDEERGEWKTEILQEHFDHVDVEEILKIKLSGSRIEDIVAWHFEPTGMFSVKCIQACFGFENSGY